MSAGRSRRARFQRLGAGARGGDAVAALRQMIGDERDDVGLVVDHEDALSAGAANRVNGSLRLKSPRDLGDDHLDRDGLCPPRGTITSA